MTEQPNPNNAIARSMLYIAATILVGLALFLFFDRALKEQHNPNSSPLTTQSGQVAEVILQRNKYGHYVANGLINGEEVLFLLDTGATHVAIPEHIANQLGLSRRGEHRVETANGSITVYDTLLRSVSLGNIELNSVIANINPYMDGDDILLGMSFLKELEFTQSGDTLSLRKLQ